MNKALAASLLVLAPTLALANTPEIQSQIKATCYGYLLVHRADYPKEFKQVEAMVKADQHAGRYVVAQHRLFTSSRAQVFKPLAVDNCQKLNIKIS